MLGALIGFGPFFKGELAWTRSHKVASNPGACLSDVGFEILLTAMRVDLPSHLLRQLLLSATEAVRSRLLALAPMKVQEEVRCSLAAVSNAVHREVSKPRDFTTAQALVALLQDTGELKEETLFEFAKQRKYEETVAALAALSHATIEIIRSLMQSPRDDGLLVPCKVADLRWKTVSAVLEARGLIGSNIEKGMVKAETEFAKLSKANAKRLLRFWQIRASTLNLTPTLGGKC